MKNFNYKLAFFITILSLTSIFFIRIILESYRLQSQIAVKERQVQGDHKPIKIFPEKGQANFVNKDQKIYDYINQKSWKFDPKIENKKAKEKEIESFKSQEENQEKPKSGDIIQYKNHKIKLVKAVEEKREIRKKYKILVQIGAFDSTEKAGEEWHRISKLFPGLLKNYQFFVEKGLNKKKGIIYRLRIGPFTTQTKARNFCENLRKKTIGCFLIVN